MNESPTGSMRVMALDFGAAHTGVAISDPTGVLAQPLDDISDAGSPSGMAAVAALVEREGAQLVIVGMPVSLSGEMGEQARVTAAFVAALAPRLGVPVETWDERYTSRIARSRGRAAKASQHSIAAACLLQDYLDSEEFSRRRQG